MCFDQNQSLIVPFEQKKIFEQKCVRHVTPAVMGNLEILTKNIVQIISKSQTRYTYYNGEFGNFDQKFVFTKTNHFLFHLRKKNCF